MLRIIKREVKIPGTKAVSPERVRRLYLTAINMNLSRKILLVGLTVSIMTGGCGCMREIGNSASKKAVSYLESKYERKFTFIETGNDVWPS